MDNVKKNAGETGRDLEQRFLLRTGPKAGFVPGNKLFKINRMGARAGINLDAKPNPSHGDLIVSAWITSKNWKRPVAETTAADKSDKDAADKPSEKKPAAAQDNVNVILTADLDLFHDAFFSLRNEVLDEDFKFDNFFAKRFGIYELAEYSRFYRLWFDNNGSFDRWLISMYYRRRFCNNGYSGANG